MASTTSNDQAALNAHPAPGPITHIVAYTFDFDTTQKEANSVVERMLGLKQKCLNPQGKPYIKSLIGGTNNSPSKRNEAITHAFISEFATSEDRNYYLFKDPVHLAFEASLSGIISRALAVDFTPATFKPLSEL